MQLNTFRIAILLATFSVLGIVGSQVYWILKAIDLNTERFDRQVESALLTVSRQLLNNVSLDDSRLQQPVKKVRDDYWVVMVNDVIDANLLEHLLRQSLVQRQIKSDFEYAIYDCESQQLRYGNMIRLSSTQRRARVETVRWPKWDQSAHYFGVYFASREDAVLAGMQSWILSSVGVLFVVFFFSFTVLTLVRQRKLSEVQRDFINNLAHEFKTPISTISLSAQGLAGFSGVAPDEKIIRYASVIKSEAGRLSEQVEKILEVARTDGGSLHLDKSVFSLNALVAQIRDQVTIPDNRQPVTIRYVFPDREVYIKADKLHITNIIFNLLDNAIKYGNVGNIIEISFNKAGANVVLVVKDKGVGISKSKRYDVFKKFYRITTGNVVQARGFGLGLYYVRTIVKAHYGRIFISDEPDWNTVINLFIPLRSNFRAKLTYYFSRLVNFKQWS